MVYRVLIVDDEPLARQRLRALLARQGELEVAAEAEDVAAAAAAIGALSPDAVFLDVGLPEVDGFRLFDAVGPARMPAVVLVTAHERHAVRAFDVEAVDFLLKPFDEARFAATLRRLREALAERGPRPAAGPVSASAAGPAEPRYPPRLALRSTGRVTFLSVDEIDWIDAAHNYVKIHAAGRTYTCREVLGELASRLDPRRFARIHRSTLVNLERVQSLELTAQGGHLAVMANGQRLSLSRSYRDRLQSLLEAAG